MPHFTEHAQINHENMCRRKALYYIYLRETGFNYTAIHSLVRAISGARAFFFPFQVNGDGAKQTHTHTIYNKLTHIAELRGRDWRGSIYVLWHKNSISHVLPLSPRLNTRVLYISEMRRPEAGRRRRFIL